MTDEPEIKTIFLKPYRVIIPFSPSDLRSASRESRRLEELKEATAGSSEEVKW